jgi:hypothetical protein
VRDVEHPEDRPTKKTAYLAQDLKAQHTLGRDAAAAEELRRLVRPEIGLNFRSPYLADKSTNGTLVIASAAGWLC